MEKIKTVIEILNKYTQEMENYAYYGSNPGIPESEYPEIATEIVQAVMGWQPIETAPEMVHVLACNSGGYVGRAIKIRGKWEHIGMPTHWMPLPMAAF